MIVLGKVNVGSSDLMIKQRHMKVNPVAAECGA
jgi:hypothetical protein